MKVAIIGSRSLTINNLVEYLSEGIEEIVSGGAKGIDLCAKNYAMENEIKFTEFPPEYNKYRRNAPLMRNLKIIEYADLIIAFWDGKSHGTKFVIDNCKKQNKNINIHIINNNDS